MTRIDHITAHPRKLEAAVDVIEQRHGVRPRWRGTAQRAGTHRPLALGPQTYLGDRRPGSAPTGASSSAALWTRRCEALWVGWRDSRMRRQDHGHSHARCGPKDLSAVELVTPPRSAGDVRSHARRIHRRLWQRARGCAVTTALGRHSHSQNIERSCPSWIGGDGGCPRRVLSSQNIVIGPAGSGRSTTSGSPQGRRVKRTSFWPGW